jgi:hypothetical protein
MNCPLCKHPGKLFYGKQYFICNNCAGIYRNKNEYLSTDDEVARYKKHNNDVNDAGHQKFVSPITTYVQNNFTANHCGLDFGSGTESVVSKILKDEGYDILQYDPCFIDNIALLNKEYDYIVCCEVIEHFHKPGDEFELLRNLLKASGALICMTHLYSGNTDFKSWYYKNDPTHVFFYHQETTKYIADNYGFSNCTVNDRLIVFQT